MDEIESIIQQSGIEYVVNALFTYITFKAPDNSTDELLPRILSFDSDLQSKWLLHVQKYLVQLPLVEIEKIYTICDYHLVQFSNSFIVQSLLRECRLLLHKETDIIKYDSPYILQDWDPTIPFSLHQNESINELTHDATQLDTSITIPDVNTTIRGTERSSLSQSFTSFPQSILQLFTSLQMFLSDSSLRCLTDQTRVTMAKDQIQEILNFLNANSSLASFLPQYITTIPEPYFILLKEFLLASSNTQNTFQVIIQSYLYPLLIADSQTIISRDLFTVLCKALTINYHMTIQYCILPCIQPSVISTRTSEMIQRLFMNELQPQIKYTLYTEIINKENQMAISDLALPILLIMIQKDENLINMNSLVYFVSKCIEQKERLNEVQLLSLLRTMIKKYMNQLAGHKELLQSLINRFDQTKPLVKVLHKMILKL